MSPVAVLTYSTEYICPWLSCVSSPWKISSVVVFIPKARALMSSLLLLTVWELPAQKVATHTLQVTLLLLPGCCTPGCFVKHSWRYISENNGKTTLEKCWLFDPWEQFTPLAYCSARDISQSKCGSEFGSEFHLGQNAVYISICVGSF